MLAITAAGGICCAPALGDQTVRQAIVEHRSESVMPFSMNATRHVFAPTPVGGTQAVIVSNGDPAQVALVRSHLSNEARKFADGDFADPAAIHGSAMPGLAELEGSRGRIAISYAAVPRGGRIVFATHDPQLVSAVHRWFAAQTADHGSHAMMMKMGMTM